MKSILGASALVDEDVPGTPAERPLVYVHLDYGRSPETWLNAYKKGLVFEQGPYGYHWTSPWVRLTYSTDRPESKAFSLCRRGMKFLLGFDLIHAFHNRRHADAVDVIWTHTESEWLADALLMKLGLMKRAPLVGQSVWLWDKWSKWSVMRQRIHRWLLEEVAVPTTLSPTNARFGSELIGREVLFVPFGIEPTFDVPIKSPTSVDKVRVVAPGNDRDRDWATLQQVAKNNPDIEITVLSRRRQARKLVEQAVPNFVVRQAAGIEDLIAQYATADVVAVPLKPNMHASGITVAMEGLNAGRPVVITKVGGVEEYFAETVDYVPPNDAVRMAEAFRCAAKKATNAELLEHNRQHLIKSGLMIKDYGLRHVLLTRLALGICVPGEMQTLSDSAPIELAPSAQLFRNMKVADAVSDPVLAS